MHVLRDKKLWKAVGLAVGLFALVPFTIGMRAAEGPPTFWNTYLWPRLAMVLLAMSVIAAAIGTGVVTRCRRPERLAAYIGALGALAVFTLPRVFAPLPPHAHHGPTLNRVLGAVIWYWIVGAPLVLACWLGANHLRQVTWQRFVRGPGGAIVRAGVVALVLTLPVCVSLWWYTYPTPRGYYQLGHPPAVFPWRDFLVLLAFLPGALPGAALFAALLAPIRPTRLLGAFAGGGIAVALSVLFLLPLMMLASGATDPVLYRMHQLSLRVEAIKCLSFVVMGVVAGSFAGRWEPEPLPDE